MVLIDSSCWIEALRRHGNVQIREEVHQLILKGEAGWCDLIRVELWVGARGLEERKTLRAFEADLITFPLDQQVWSKACQLAEKSRDAGKTIPATDLIIAACAWRHRVPLKHHDAHLTFLLELISKDEM